jgi:hypothetical protein
MPAPPKITQIQQAHLRGANPPLANARGLMKKARFGGAIVSSLWSDVIASECQRAVSNFKTRHRA